MMQLMFTVRQHIRLISIIWKLVPTAARLLCKDSQNSNFIHEKLQENQCHNVERLQA